MAIALPLTCSYFYFPSGSFHRVYLAFKLKARRQERLVSWKRVIRLFLNPYEGPRIPKSNMFAKLYLQF